MVTSLAPDALRMDAPRHAELLQSISELEYVPTTIKMQEDYVGDLEQQVTESYARLESLTEQTQKERAEYEKMRDATAVKLAHTLTGRGKKFEAKAHKEERYVSIFTPVTPS